MNEHTKLEPTQFLDEVSLETLCDKMFQKVEEEYVDQDEFESTFKELGRRLPI